MKSLIVALLGTMVASVASAQYSPVPGTEAECVPACREGYVCHQGQCISACNPPCEGGQVCTAGGQCAASTAAQPAPAAAPGYQDPVYAQPTAAPAPFPTVAPSAADQPPPAGAWEPEYEGRRRGEYHFRPYAGFTFNLGGAAADSSGSDGLYDSYDYDLDAGIGFDAGFEFRFGRIFGLAPAVRAYTLGRNAYDISVIDVLLTPTFHVPLGMVEVLIPIQLGPEFTSNVNDDGGVGFVFGINPGVAIWFLPFLGMHVQIGFALHIIDHGPYATVAYRPLLNTGIDFAF